MMYVQYTPRGTPGKTGRVGLSVIILLPVKVVAVQRKNNVRVLLQTFIYYQSKSARLPQLLMGLAQLIGRIDDALIGRESVSTVRGLLFDLLEQTEALEENVLSLETQFENDPISKENNRLRDQLKAAFDEIERLQADSHERSICRRSEIQDDILRCIACLGAHSTTELVESLSLDGESIHFHLHQLQDVNLIGPDDELRWTLFSDGRCYSKKHGFCQHFAE